MAKYLLSNDTLSGKEGTVTFVVDGNVEVGAYVKSLTATYEKNKSEVPVLGFRGTQMKTTGWKGSGEMTLYYVTTLFRQMALDYVKNGKDVFFDITVENDDPTSSIGKQTIVLYRCNLDDTVIAKLDGESDALEEDLKFSFESFDILDSFAEPKNI